MSTAPWVSRVVRRIQVKRDTDTDVDIYVNKDNRPLPPLTTSLRSVALCLTLDGYGFLQCRRMDNGLVCHLTRP